MNVASDTDLAAVLDMKTIAVVGLSPNPLRTSHSVSATMQGYGYRIIPVNPGQEEILGEKAYPSLSAIPGPVDIVDVFPGQSLPRPSPRKPWPSAPKRSGCSWAS